MNRIFISAGKQFCTRENHISAPLLRRVFSCDNCDKKTNKKIEISVAGFYRLWLNGKELTKGFFAPYISNPDNVIRFDEYDVSELIAKENVVCILLGNGFNNCMDGGVWGFEQASFRSAPKVHINITNDNTLLISSDENFEVYDSPITFDDIRGGERYDARIEIKELLKLNPNKSVHLSSRKAVIANEPKGIYRKCLASPVIRGKEISPIDISKCNDGYIYDFGQNSSGVYRLNIDAFDGQIIDMIFVEVLQNGEADISNVTCGSKSPIDYVQHDIYICRNGKQEYTPSFTFHGYRYIKVKGITEEQANKSLFTYITLHGKFDIRGNFKCSSEIVNKIQQCTVASDLSNFYYFPTDCPQREKNGWTADASLSAEQMLYNFDCSLSLKEWLFDIRTSQKDNGALPGIIPTAGWGYEWGNGPAWDSVLIEIPYRLYKFNGDTQVISENLSAIYKYFKYLKSKLNENNLIAFGLGDWCETGTLQEEGFSTPLEVTDSLVSLDIANKSIEMFRAINELEKANEIYSFKKNIFDSFRKKYIKNGKCICNTQTALAMCIGCNIFLELELTSGCKQLCDLLQKYSGHFQVGVIGARWLFDSLSKIGKDEIALNSIIRKDFPSYGYIIERGATTLWEAFNELTDEKGKFKRKDNGRILSLNHHFWGCVSGWFYSKIGGLKILGKNKLIIEPSFNLNLSWAETEYRNGENYIKINWKKEGNNTLVFINNNGFQGDIFLGEKRHYQLEEGEKSYVLYGN